VVGAAGGRLWPLFFLVFGFWAVHLWSAEVFFFCLGSQLIRWSVSMNHVQQCVIWVSHSDVSIGSVLPRCDSRGIWASGSWPYERSQCVHCEGSSLDCLVLEGTHSTFLKNAWSHSETLRNLLEDCILRLQNVIAMDREVWNWWNAM
jgi:hypothetical protein